jgi:O-antigen/teichoic acid export membrane protein
MDFLRVYDRSRLAVERLLLGEGLRAKAVRGGMWLGGGSTVEQASRFARNMVLTRLLAPSAFGTMAIVMSCSTLLGSLTDVGLKAAIVQNPRGAEDSYLNASWWMGMGRAICLYAIIFAMAPWISRFYGIPELSALLRVALLSTLLDGAMSPRSSLPQKEMNFPRWAAITNGGAICGVILTVALSFIIRDVWALAIGSCSENAFRFLLSYILCPGLPQLGWDSRAARDLLRFSRGIMGLSFLNIIFTRADIFVLAKLYSPADLGLYTMAVALVQTPSSFLTGLLGQTFLPVFSRVQEDRQRVNRIVEEVTSWLILLGLPAVVVICVSGKSLLTLIYGSRYAAGAAPLALASGVVFLNALNVVLTIVFYGKGRPALHRRAVAATAITMVVTIYPFSLWLGVAGAQVAALLSIVAGYLLQIVRMRGLTGLNLLRYARGFGPPIILSVGVLTFCLGAHSFGLAAKPVANIMVAGAACLVAYGLYLPALLRNKPIA